MFIEQVTKPTVEIVEALERLIPQLTSSHPGPGVHDLAEMLQGSSNVLLIAREPDEKGRIVGSGSLGIYRVPTGVRGVIEDVVVDEGARGLGIGEALVRRLLQLASQSGAMGVSLTSNPRRLEANRLYVRLGFSLRRTNCYFYDLR